MVSPECACVRQEAARWECGLARSGSSSRTMEVRLSDSKDPGELLAGMRQGDPKAIENLIRLTYKELRRLAGHYMRSERPEHTLQPTALVHEVYLRIFADERLEWNDQKHFFAVAAKQMRRVLLDYARSRT